MERRKDLEGRRIIDNTIKFTGKPVIHYKGDIKHIGLENCLHYLKLSQIENDTKLMDEVKEALLILTKEKL